MGLHIVIGFDAPGTSAKPSLVYLGRVAGEAAAAREADTTSERFEVFSNLVGVRKNNPRHRPPPPPPAPPSGDEEQKQEAATRGHRKR